MTIAFLKRLFATLPTLAAELGLEVQQWWSVQLSLNPSLRKKRKQT